MLEIKKIKVKKDGQTIFRDLSLKIENGKIEIVKDEDSLNYDILLQNVCNKECYEIKIDDILFDSKSFKSFFNAHQNKRELFNKIHNEVNLMYKNKFKPQNIVIQEDDNITDYVSEQINIEDGTFNLPILELPKFDINDALSEIEDDHFIISGQILDNNGFSLIQFIGLIISLGIIVLTATRVYGATVSASNVGYSGSSSGLSSTSVQGAIDQTYSAAVNTCATYYCLERSRIWPTLFAKSADGKAIFLAGTADADVCINSSSTSATNCTWKSIRGNNYAVGDSLIIAKYPEESLWLNNVKIAYCSTSGCYLV